MERQAFFDRLLATRMGAAATDCIAHSEFGVLVGITKGDIGTTPLTSIVGRRKTLEPDMLRLARVLAQ